MNGLTEISKVPGSNYGDGARVAGAVRIIGHDPAGELFDDLPQVATRVFRARLVAFAEILGMAVSAAGDTTEAIVANDFRKARQRVSEGMYALWQLNAALEVMRQPGFSPPTSVAAAPVNPQRKTSK